MLFLEMSFPFQGRTGGGGAKGPGPQPESVWNWPITCWQPSSNRRKSHGNVMELSCVRRCLHTARTGKMADESEVELLSKLEKIKDIRWVYHYLSLKHSRLRHNVCPRINTMYNLCGWCSQEPWFQGQIEPWCRPLGSPGPPWPGCEVPLSPR